MQMRRRQKGLYPLSHRIDINGGACLNILWRNKYRNCKQPAPIFTVIIAAAGSGMRMGGAYKPIIYLNGQEMLSYSLDIFQDSGFVKQVIVSAKAENIEDIWDLIRSKGYTKVRDVIAGGQTRQLSVEKAFVAVFKEKEDITPYVAIHDAARPLLTAERFDTACRTALRYGSAVCASKTRDTVKRADVTGKVYESVDRDRLWQIQTPQIFDTDLYHTALALAKKNGQEAPDDSTLILQAGFAVQLVECGYDNFKVTYPEDIPLAEAILKARKETIS